MQTLLHRHGLTASSFYDADGCSLLHWAAVNGRVLILQQIIQSIPSDRSTVSTVVNTPGGALCEIPLQWACRYPHLSEVVRLLLQHGSDANFRNVHGQSSLHIGTISLYHRLLKISSLLLQQLYRARRTYQYLTYSRAWEERTWICSMITAGHRCRRC